MPTTEKVLYLTFDDGPTPEITSQVLEILQTYSAKATFFLCGQKAEIHQDMVNQTINCGHAIGNHTYSHLDGWTASTNSYIAEVDKTARIVPGKLFRPPYGHLRINQYRHLQKYYRIVIWDVMCGDFDPKISPSQCFHKIVENARPGSVVVFHDTVKASPNMLYALQQTLILYGKQGFRFDALYE